MIEKTVLDAEMLRGGTNGCQDSALTFAVSLKPIVTGERVGCLAHGLRLSDPGRYDLVDFKYFSKRLEVIECPIF